jgi:hypothetical protein
MSYADRMARLASSRIGRRCILRFDLGRQEIARYDGPAARSKMNVGQGVQMPVRFRIDRVLRRAAGPEAARGALDARGAGVVDIEYSPSGRSESYALRLQAGDDAFWIAFSGLTGQLTPLKDEQEVDNLFSLLATGRPDPH